MKNNERMQQIEYQLLKLDNAYFSQGKDKERQAKRNVFSYERKQLNRLKLKKQFYNQIEILNRQSLPLQEEFQKRVQKYFLNKSKD